MNPVIGAAKVDKILSQFSQMYRSPSFIAEQILPRLKVKEKTGKFAKYGKDNMRAYDGAIYRAPGTRAHTIDYTVSQGTYICKERAVEKPVPDEMYANTDEPYDPRRDAVAVAMDNIATNMELALSQSMGDTAVITQNVTLAGTDQWSDAVNSDPIGDIDTAVEAVRASTGTRPNVILFSQNVWVKFKSHPDIREQLKYTNAGQPSDQQCMDWIKGFWRVEEVLIGDAVYNSADMGQTDNVDDIWANNVWVLFRTKTPTLMRATFGMTISDVPRQVDMYREESHLRDVVRVRDSFDQNLMDVNLCYLIKNAV